MSETRKLTESSDRYESEQIKDKLVPTTSAEHPDSDTSKKNRTKFEDLPNEFCYDVFNYFHAHELFYTFYGINSRYDRLVTTARLKIDLHELSKSSFIRCCEWLDANVAPQQVVSITLSNEHAVGLIRLFDEQFDLQKFSQLQSLKHISFQIICDGFTELLPININGRNETEREQWPCNNIYTHCNGLWNCLNDEDELDCDLSSPSSSSSNCSSDQHQCASPDINQFI
ncbi:unnamed protein product [Rotaria sordida]|uniref:F-box domain-containing protein n=1 Tax=Rotaria sordida TaxID=392033 RepID=A0A815P0I1_9BILA|nr:unnamed protein product [Rotaria sordida]